MASRAARETGAAPTVTLNRRAGPARPMLGKRAIVANRPRQRALTRGLTVAPGAGHAAPLARACICLAVRTVRACCSTATYCGTARVDRGDDRTPRISRHHGR